MILTRVVVCNAFRDRSSGEIDAHELQAALGKIGLVFEEEGAIELAMAEIDVDADGRITAQVGDD